MDIYSDSRLFDPPDWFDWELTPTYSFGRAIELTTRELNPFSKKKKGLTLWFAPPVWDSI